MERIETRAGAVELYSATARRFHWWTVLLLLVQVPLGLYMVYRGNTLQLWDDTTNRLFSSHKLLGIMIFVVVAARLLYRLAHGAPADEPTITWWQRLAGHLNHWSLYALLLVTPIVGYIGISQYPALDIFGVKLPGVAKQNTDAAKGTFFIHFVLAMLLVLAAAMHVAAALFHYIIRRDNVLARMLPSLRRS